jgi:hypothetical protein
LQRIPIRDGLGILPVRINYFVEGDVAEDGVHDETVGGSSAKVFDFAEAFGAEVVVPSD